MPTDRKPLFRVLFGVHLGLFALLLNDQWVRNHETASEEMFAAAMFMVVVVGLGVLTIGTLLAAIGFVLPLIGFDALMAFLWLDTRQDHWLMMSLGFSLAVAVGLVLQGVVLWSWWQPRRCRKP